MDESKSMLKKDRDLLNKEWEALGLRRQELAASLAVSKEKEQSLDEEREKLQEELQALKERQYIMRDNWISYRASVHDNWSLIARLLISLIETEILIY